MTEGVLFSTLLGGDGDDRVQAVAFKNDRIYVVGRTRSTIFPGVRTRLGTGGMDDGFLSVIEVNKGVPKLHSSARIGGQSNDVISALVITDDNRVVVAGHSDSADFPQKSVEPTTLAGRNAFMAEMLEDDWAWSTVFGGRGDDSATALGVDGEGMLFLAGVTASSDFPLRNGVQMAHAGSTDGFVARFSPDAKVLLYATLLGGADRDEITAMHVDSSGYATVTGFTQSTDFPLTRTSEFRAGSTDAFVSQIGVSGGFLNYSLRFGGVGGDIGESVSVQDGQVVLSGKSWSDQWRPHAGTGNSGLWDAFVVTVDETTLTASEEAGKLFPWEKSSALLPKPESRAVDGEPLPVEIAVPISMSVNSAQKETPEAVPVRPVAYSQRLQLGINARRLLRLQGNHPNSSSRLTVHVESTTNIQGKLTLLDASLGLFRYQSPDATGKDQISFRLRDGDGQESDVAVVDIDVVVPWVVEEEAVSIVSSEIPRPVVDAPLRGEELVPMIVPENQEPKALASESGIDPIPVSDVEIQVIDSPDPVAPNSELTYVAIVKNHGPFVAKGVKVVVDGEIRPLSIWPSQGECVLTPEVRCFLGDIASGSAVSVTLVSYPEPAVGKPQVNAQIRVEVSDSENDPQSENNRVLVTTEVRLQERGLRTIWQRLRGWWMLDG